MTKLFTGLTLMVFAGATLVYWEVFWVRPALTPLPQGGYGEMYGPVSFFRLPIAIGLSLCIAAGLALAMYGLLRSRSA